MLKLKVRFVSKLSLRLKVGLALLATVLVVLPVSAAPLLQGVISGGEVWAAWTRTDFDNAAMQFTNVTGTVVVSPRSNVTGTSGVFSLAIPNNTNYPLTWYTPTPPGGQNWLALNVADSGSAPAFFDVTITFSKPILNPKFHFQNPDIGTIDFAATPGINLTRVSGNNEFEVTGTVVNSTPNAAANAGCEDNGGGNPNGACGTITLNGTYQTVIMRVTDTIVGNGSGDGSAFTISMVEPTTAVGGVAELITPRAGYPVATMAGMVIMSVMLMGAGAWLMRRA